MRVSSKSSTKVYVLLLASPSSAGRKGGVTLGRLVKLLGNWAPCVEAMADALRIANGFLPVMDEPPPEEDPTKLELPLVFVELEMPLAPMPDPFPG